MFTQFVLFQAFLFYNNCFMVSNDFFCFIMTFVFTQFYGFKELRGLLNKFPDFFFVWALLLIVHIWNSSPLPSNLLQLQCTFCTVPTTSGRPHGSSLLWACQWPSSQPLSSLQFSHNERQPMSLGNKQKSQGARSGLQGGWGTVLMPILVK